MGVFSSLSDAELRALVARWPVGEVRDIAPTDHGIENSNYFVTPEERGAAPKWVLTIMDHPPRAEALRLTHALAAAGLPVPEPLAERQGARIIELSSGFALLAPAFAGCHPEQPDADQCRALGRWMGQAHETARTLTGEAHPRTLDWLAAKARAATDTLSAESRTRFAEALRVLEAHATSMAALPEGLVHGDLFRDNLLFDGATLTGVIDFHHAARAPLLFDLAVVLNDLSDPLQGGASELQEAALLEGYESLRPLEQAERELMSVMRLLAAVRFWASRLASPRKNPQAMESLVARFLDR